MAAQTIGASVSDSASFVAMTNGNVQTLVQSVLKVVKLADAPAATVLPGNANVTVLTVRIKGSGGDTLTNLALENLGTMDDTDVNVKLYRDADGSLDYTAGDTFVAELIYDTVAGRWETGGLLVSLDPGGDTFVFTIDVSAAASPEYATFQARVPSLSADAVTAETGPSAAVDNANKQTLIFPGGIANHVVIAAVYPDAIASDANGEWILLYNPTNSAVNLQNWKIVDSGTTDATLPDSDIPAHGYFLIADAGWVKDNNAWPNADYEQGLTLNNSNDGFSLVDSNAQIIDRFGYGAADPDFEGTAAANPGANTGDIYIRIAHSLTSSKEDILQGGRDEFGGMGYDSYSNAGDFVKITGSDSNFWTLRNSASAPETPAHFTTVVKIFDTAPSRNASQQETKVVALVVYIQGETNANSTLTAFRVAASDTLADTNFKHVWLYRDENGNSQYDPVDSLVAELMPTGNAEWDTRGISFTFDALNGETFMVLLDIADTVTDGETFQARVDLRTAKAANADSGPTVVRTNSGIITLSNLNPIVVQKNADIVSDTVSPTQDTITVMAFRLIGDASGDTLTWFTIVNDGTLTTADVSAVHLWIDADADSAYSAGDTLVSTLIATGARRWEDTQLAQSIGTAGLDFVVTIDLGTATNGETFQARIPADSSDAQIADTGPRTGVLESGMITVSTAVGVTMWINEVDVNGAPDYVELLVLDDGNGGAGVDVSGWTLTEYPLGGADRKVVGDTDNDGVADTPVIARTGEFIVIFDGAGTDESTSGADNMIEQYNSGLAFTSTGDEVILYDNTNVVRDAVVWSNYDGTPSKTWEKDFAGVMALGVWEGAETVQAGAVTPRSAGGFDANMSIQRGGIDRDTYLDWGEAVNTMGAANAMESPPVPGPRVTGVNLTDVPDDMGGVLQVTWKVDTSLSDFKEYRVYVETGPLANLLAQDTNKMPVATITDSSVGVTQVTGLTDGESYYAAVTIVDSYGLEYRFGLNDTGPSFPIRNVTGAPDLRINEVNFRGTNLNADTDYIEIFVADDGNPTGNLNLAGWKIEAYSGITKTIGDVTVGDGDYILLEFENSSSDDADSSGDNVVNLYDAGAGLNGTDGFVRILTAQDTLVDFVFYANRDGTLAGGLITEVRAGIDSGGWTGDTTENSAVNPASLSGFVNGDILARDGNSSDTSNSRNDWNVTTTRSKGAANTGIEQPITVPDSRAVTLFRDLPDDFGGTLEIAWDTITTLNDFVRYNIYLETKPIGSRIDTGTQTPAATITDSSTATTTVGGLIDGESYWVVVTVTDTWGHERRTGLVDTGPVMPKKNVTGTPRMVFSEVKFSGTDTEFIEIRVIDDGNPTGNLNIAGFRVTNDDSSTAAIISFGSVTVGDSDFIVLWNKPIGASESDSGGDGVVNIYPPEAAAFSLAEGDEGLFLVHSGDTILDFVQWSTRDGSLGATETSDLADAIQAGAWANLGVTQNNARNPLPFIARGLNDFDNSASITRDRNFTDNNGDTDWAIDSPATPGASPNITEAPFAAPGVVTGVSAADVPNDFGGNVTVSWNPVAVPDLHHYNVYYETGSFPVQLYDSNIIARDTVPATDTGLTIAGLTDGETYYFAITAVDSYGNELKTSYTIDSATPRADVNGETILIVEVSFKENASSGGVLGYDWVELLVDTDGTGGNGITLNGWQLISSATGNPDKALDGVTAYPGDRILIHATAGTDEADSMAGNGDGIIDLYYGAGTALTGTDNSLTLYRPMGDTEDFVAWTSPAGAPVNANDSAAIAAAIAAGEWTDFAPAGVGTEDGVNSDSASTNYSIARYPDASDANAKSDWRIDSSPTPGEPNDSSTRWRITGTLDLEGRTDDSNVPVSVTNGTDTYWGASDASGSYVIRVPNGSYTLTADTSHYLRAKLTGLTVNYQSLLNQDVGTMYAGDANNDERINIFDASMTKYAIDHNTGNPAADHVDPLGVIDAADLRVIRNNFGKRGD